MLGARPVHTGWEAQQYPHTHRAQPCRGAGIRLPILPLNLKAEQLYPDAWGLQIELGAPGCLEALKMRGRALLGGPGIPIWKAWARHSLKPLTASLCNSWAESAVLGKSQSAPGACRHHCVQKLQVASSHSSTCLHRRGSQGRETP